MSVTWSDELGGVTQWIGLKEPKEDGISVMEERREKRLSVGICMVNDRF